MLFDLPTNSDASLHHIVQAVVTVLAVINRVVCGSIFLTLTPKLALARQWAAVKAALSILIILVTSALVGLKVLSIFNISLDVFRIVGG
jgi:multiple antibiotic resistance protein